jgi:hypothetical protein
MSEIPKQSATYIIRKTLRQSTLSLHYTQPVLSLLYYSYSFDGGETMSVWNSSRNRPIVHPPDEYGAAVE